MKCSELIRILKRDGWIELRRAGSHIIMSHPQKDGKLSIPFHASGEVKKGMLNFILKKAEIEIKKR